MQNHNGDSWSGFDGNDNAQVTGTQLDEVMLTGEEKTVPIFPESTADIDSLLNTRARKTLEAERDARVQADDAQRSAMRRRRFTALSDRAIQFIEDRRLLPASWLARSVESGERWPVFVCVLKNNYERWGRTAAATVSAVASALWLIQLVLGTPTAVIDGRTITNLYRPSTPYLVALSSPAVGAWLDQHRRGMHEIRGADLRAGYFPAHVYHKGDDRPYNITLDWLARVLPTACNHGAPDPADRCVCMPAVEIGVLANVVFLDNIVMIDPHITAVSAERAAVTYDDGTTGDKPLAIVLEYTHRSTGAIERRKEQGRRAICIQRSIDLVEQP